jgi:hypothetical protein
MRSSKERKMERKAKHKALAVAKTIKSRQRRLDNKAKRDEILAINPDAKITIVDGITYMNGAKVKVINGQIKSHLNTTPLVNETVEVFNPEIGEVEAVEVNDINKFQKLVNKWR